MNGRRTFLRLCAALSLTASAVPSSLMAGMTTAVSGRRSLSELSREDFAGQIETVFRVHAAPGRSIEVTLSDVVVKSRVPMVPGYESFSLLFSGTRPEKLSQETYTFEHDVLGWFDCFIVPIGTRDRQRIYYEMVCHRPRRPRR